MKQTQINCLVVIGVLFLMVSSSVVSAASPPQRGDLLPEMNLSIPKDPVHRSYLGLTGQGVFQIPQIKARVVLVEIFSMYCPVCQREAPRVNELYRDIESNPKTKGKIKIIGIGAGNSAFEVNVFREKYHVPFPLFADADFAMHKCLGETRTPYFIGVKMNTDGSHQVFYSKLGGFKNAGDFLDQLLELSGLK